MDYVGSFMALVIGAQVAPESTFLSVQEAAGPACEAIVRRILLQESRESIDKEIWRSLMSLSAADKLTSVERDDIIRRFVQKSIFPGIKTLSFPSSLSTRYGDLTSTDLIDVYYIEHPFQQDDGWSCGYRTVFNAAGVEDYFRMFRRDEAGREPPRLDGCLERFFNVPDNDTQQLIHVQENLDVQAAVKFLAQQYRVRQVRGFLGKKIELIEPAIEYLQQDSPRIAEAVYKLQPDYFIVTFALQFLEKGNTEEAKLLLEKAHNKDAKVIKRALSDLESNRNPDEIKEVLEQFEELYIREAIDQLCQCDNEIRRLLSLIKATKDLKVKAALVLILAEHEEYKEDYIYKNILEVLRKSDDSSIAGWIDSLKNSCQNFDTGIKSLWEFDKDKLEEAVTTFQKFEEDPITENREASKVLTNEVVRRLRSMKKVVHEDVVEMIRRAKKCARLLITDVIEDNLTGKVELEEVVYVPAVIDRVMIGLRTGSHYSREALNLLPENSRNREELKECVKRCISRCGDLQGVPLFRTAKLMLEIELNDKKVQSLRGEPGGALAYEELDLILRNMPKPFKWLDDPDVLRLCFSDTYQLNLRTIHILGIPEGQVRFNRFEAAGDDEWDRHMEREIKQHIEQHAPGPLVHHFLSNLPGSVAHWMLVSLVKLPQRDPFLLMLDSLNSPVDERRAKVLGFLYKKFIKPDDPNNPN